MASKDASIGKPLKAVLAAKIKMAAVAACTVEERPAPEDGSCDLSEHGLGRRIGRQAEVGGAFGDVDVEREGERRDADEHGDGKEPHDRECVCGVLGLRLFERRHTVADGLHARQRGAARGGTALPAG